MAGLGFLTAAVVQLRFSTSTQRKCSNQGARVASMVLRAPAGAEVLSSDRAAELPWTKSVAGDDTELLFMPFLEHQLEVMQNELDLEDYPFEADLSLQLSEKKPAKIESWQWRTPEFRKIRATYIDAGLNAQVFNSVWYPSPEYDVPLLGIDFLSFGKKKVICVLDFQPLVQDAAYLAQYCEPIQYIKEKYEGIAGTMSKRFYDETLFFSKQLAFAKFDNPDPVKTQLFPAFKEYLRDYLKLIRDAEPNDDADSVQRVLDLHKEYDVYSAERDPAVGLFATYWGKEWANKFTHEFLFSDSEMPVEEESEVKAKKGKESKAKST